MYGERLPAAHKSLLSLIVSSVFEDEPVPHPPCSSHLNTYYNTAFHPTPGLGPSHRSQPLQQSCVPLQYRLVFDTVFCYHPTPGLLSKQGSPQSALSPTPHSSRLALPPEQLYEAEPQFEKECMNSLHVIS
ncbi:hypothetical protein FIBSPDRAFT_897234 [Athelia psychrophila]|uniref:Uncharacterized protein n=1 Tax=Athelia psychrophila TaxID=1759441 RepID=A0A166CIF1_9AGAM|nr:hypothetical protein FIBSPDRAFT_897234 [Fibularhizoctonia sp. CBS 109695]